MALTFSSTIRDQVCLALRGRVYSDCSTADQTAIGGTDGAGERALSQIQRWAHFVEMAGSDTAPDAWKRWLVHLATAEAAAILRPDRESDLRRIAIEAQRDALKTYTRSEVDGTAPADLSDTTVKLRQHIISRCVRLEPMVLPEPDIVDTAIKWTLNRIWNDADWKFTQRLAVLTIAADGTVTAADEAENALTVDKIIGDMLRYATGGGRCMSATAATILDERSMTSPTTGKPAYFHMQKSASDIRWLFAPKPDQEYTAYATIKVRTPTMTNVSTMDTAIGLYPHEFQQIIRDMAYGKVLYDLGRAEGQEFLRSAVADLIGLATSYDSPGAEPERANDGTSRPRGLGGMPSYMGGVR